MKIIDQKQVGIYSITLKEDGILYVHVSDERVESLEILKEAVRVIGEMVGNKKVPMLNSRDEFAFSSEEIRAYWAQKDSFPYCCADAYMLPTLALKMIGNAYLVVNRPARPTKFFVDQDDAIAWLKTFL